MTEATGVKKPAQGGLVERCWSAMFQQSDQPLALGSHGGRVCENRLIEWIRRGAACFCVFGALQGLAQAGGLEAPSAAVEQIPIAFADVGNARAMRATHANEAAAHLVGDGVVFIAPVSANGKTVAYEESNQSSDSGGQQLKKRSLNEALQLLLVQCIISGVVGFLLGYAGLVHWIRRWF